MEAWVDIGCERVKTIKRGAVTIIIHRPELAKPERASREEHVNTAACQLLKSIDLKRRNKNE